MISKKFYVFGLDRSGKSVFIQFLTTGEVTENLPPTVAFDIKALQFKKLKILVWDAPGQKLFRGIWLQRVNRADVIFFIVDAADQARFAEAKEELDKIVAQFRGEKAAPLILCFHKADLPGARQNMAEAKKLFNLDYIDNREVFTYETSVYHPESMKAVYDRLEKIFGLKEKTAL